MSGKIALFLHQPRCSVQSGNGILEALSPYYKFKIFTKHELEDDFFKDVEMVCFPGGVGDSDAYDYLLINHRRAIVNFIKRGGRYLGVCMGAYWADKHYFNILDGVEALQYIRRPGTDIRRYYSKAADITWKNAKEKMFFYDGCALVGDQTKFKTIATYSNNDPMAIIQNRIGLIGCHPESQEFWYDKKYLKPHWHNGSHHKLLLDFVDELMKS